MGTRIVYQIKDDEGGLVATLFSNSSHETQFAEYEFKSLLQSTKGPNALIEACLKARYETAEGGHQAGDRVFWIESEARAFGDYEAVVTATQCVPSEELVDKGYIPVPATVWNVERREYEGAEA